MSDFGYQNKAQSQLNISYNSLERYLQTLEKAIRTEDPYYRSLGVIHNGQYQQLNANILQIENEFYSRIRPKRVSRLSERPTQSLKRAGIEYIEVRTLDINPFSPIGFDSSQMAFIDTLLLSCLFSDSPPITAREKGENQANFSRVVRQGRHPKVCLSVKASYQPIKQVTHKILQQMEFFAQQLDRHYGIHEHIQTLKQLTEQLNDLETTYSGRILSTLKDKKLSFLSYSQGLSQSYKKEFLKKPLSKERLDYYQTIAQSSHQKQKWIEENDSMDFCAYLASYYD
jgi:glutamate--cysteine ligase